MKKLNSILKIFTLILSFQLISTTIFALDIPISSPENSNNKSLILPMSGIYTIGVGAGYDYSTFTSAVTALTSNGISGPVVFNVAPGTYTEQISFPSIVGSSTSNTITFQSANGDSNSVILNYAPSTSTINYTVALSGASYVKFTKMSISSTGSVYSSVIKISGASKNIEFTNCRIVGVPALYTGWESSVIYSLSDLNDSLIFNNNEITNGYNSFSLKGISNVYGMSERYLKITNNVISNFKNIGLVLQYEEFIEISGNSITSGLSNKGLDMEYCVDFKVRRNKIVLNGATSGYGIYLFMDRSNSYQSTLVNNFICQNGNTTALFHGIQINKSHLMYVFYNSVLINSTNILSSVFKVENVNFVCDVKNNIFVNRGNGFAIHSDSTCTATQSNFNNIYSIGITPYHFNGVTYSTFAAYKLGSGNDATSKNINPTFISNSDLHTNSYQLDKAGVPITYATTVDIDGESRDTLTPDIGADEFYLAQKDIGVVANLSFQNIACPKDSLITIRLKNFGIDTIYDAMINWQVNGIVQTPFHFIGTIISGQTSDVNIGYYPFSSNLTYNLKFWSSAPNGSVDQLQTNDTLVVSNISTYFSGVYTIGATGNFSSISSAINNLVSTGICGPVVLNIFAGTYYEQINIPPIPGSSVVNTVTLKSFNNDSASVIIMDTITSTSNYYIVKFSGADNIILNKLSLINATLGVNNRVIEFSQGSNNNVIRFCNLVGNISTYINNTNCIIYGDTSIDNNILIENNSIKNGTFGLYKTGKNNFGLESGLIIRNNSFQNQYFMSIKLDYESAPIIDKNVIITNSIKNDYNGIQLYYCVDSISVISNKIINLNNTNKYGIYLNHSGGSTLKNALIANNFICLKSSSNVVYGLFSNTSVYYSVYNNNFNIDGIYGNNTYCIFRSDNSSNYAKFRNNNFVNTSGGYAIGTSNWINSDYNNFYNTGSYLVQYLNNYDFGQWKALNFDLHSDTINPNYISFTDLHISNALMTNLGTPVSEVKYDIDGELRDTLHPDIGADEFEKPISFITGDTTACAYDSIKLQGPNSLWYSFQWMKNGTPIVGANDSIYFAKSNGSYSLKTTVGTLDSISTPLILTFKQLPDSAKTIIGATSVCQGENSISYSTAIINNAISYSWTLPSGVIGNSTTNSIIVNFSNNSTSGNIIVKGTNLCGNGVGFSLPIIVKTKPTTPIISQNVDTLYSNAPLGNQWYSQLGILNGATNQSLIPVLNGDYYSIVTINGCASDTSNKIHYINQSLEDNNNLSTIKLFPNPVTNTFTIEILENKNLIKFEIFNSVGQMVYKGSIQEKAIVDAENFTSGFYLIKIYDSENVNLMKFIKR